MPHAAILLPTPTRMVTFRLPHLFRLQSILLLSAIYYVSAKVGLLLATAHPVASPIWTASGWRCSRWCISALICGPGSCGRICRQCHLSDITCARSRHCLRQYLRSASSVLVYQTISTIAAAFILLARERPFEQPTANRRSDSKRTTIDCTRALVIQACFLHPMF